MEEEIQTKMKSSIDPISLVLGEAGYDAYCQATCGKSAVPGADLPEFEQTPEAVQAAWAAAAEAIGAVIVHGLDDEGLFEAANKLNALEAAGVNNWEGYSEAMAMLDDEGDAA